MMREGEREGKQGGREGGREGGRARTGLYQVRWCACGARGECVGTQGGREGGREGGRAGEQKKRQIFTEGGREGGREGGHVRVFIRFVGVLVVLEVNVSERRKGG